MAFFQSLFFHSKNWIGMFPFAHIVYNTYDVTYLTIPGITITHKSFVVFGNSIRCNIEWFIKKFEISNWMTNVNSGVFVMFILPSEIC